MRCDITLLFLLPCLSASQEVQRPSSHLVDALSERVRRLFVPGAPGIKGLQGTFRAPQLKVATQQTTAGKTSPARNIEAQAAAEKPEEEMITFNTAQEADPNPSKLEFSARKYFYGKVSVNIGEGYKAMQETFSPTWKEADGDSAVAVVDVMMPMGMIIEESAKHPGALEIAEVVEGSNAEKAGVKVGDIVRATTAQKIDVMAAAEGNIAFNALAGASTSGVEIKRALFVCDGLPIEGTLEAIGSNSADNGGPGVAGMVFERRMEHA